MNDPMKSIPTRYRSTLSKEETLDQVRLLLERPDDDLPAALLKELLGGVLRLHEAHLDVLDLKS